MKKRHLRASLLLAVAACAGLWTAAGTAQQRPAAKEQQPKLAYDMYEPSQRLHTRRQGCLRDEEMLGAYCVKKCDAGYQMQTAGKQVRCRAVKPLPPGSPQPPMRKQIGQQAIPKPTTAPGKRPEGS
jgi:hypothetical protein